MPSSDIQLGDDDAAIASRFLFTIDGVDIGVFKEVKGLEMSVTTVDIPEGGQNGYLLKVPGRITWPNIVFRRGLTQSDALFDWMNKTSGVGFAGNGNKLVRSTGAITAIGHTGTHLRAWNLLGCFPVKWKGPDFAVALENRTSLEEELEISHQGFTSDTTTQPAS